MQPLLLFGGAIKIPMYGYYWVHSAAQIELLAIDVPVILYNKEKNKDSHTKEEMNDLMAKWESKRKKQGKDIDFKAGEKTSLNDFLRTGMDAFKNTKTK